MKELILITLKELTKKVKGFLKMSSTVNSRQNLKVFAERFIFIE